MTSAAPGPASQVELHVTGAVQGVGFRPFVLRLARQLRLVGHVANTGSGVTILVQGEAAAVAAFVARLPSEAPSAACLDAVTVTAIAPATALATGFVIAASVAGRADAGPSALQPDAAACASCLAEVLRPDGRRAGYAFTTCAECGPRYSLAEGLPFDRERTTMREFALCAACAAEYADPADRRFHAQTLCCPDCGPELTLRTPAGEVAARGATALEQAALALGSGAIVAVKGVGGYHLMCEATQEPAVQRLRDRKRRPDKPLAVMVTGVDAARTLAAVSPTEAALLLSTAAPIVLLSAARPLAVAAAVAGSVGTLGVMVAYTPLHQLLLRAVGRPLVATSGNLAEEPLCSEPSEARARLAGIAELFLDHNRRIARPVDDSVAQVIGGRPVLLRRGRGYTPFSLLLPPALTADEPAGAVGLAVGGQDKCALAVLAPGRVHLGEHLGSLDGALGIAHCLRQLGEQPAFLGLAGRPTYLACDAHPDYVSSGLLLRRDAQVARIFHHRAHALAALCDTRAELPVLAVTWDGGGYGEDGTIWGGEMLSVRSPTALRRLCSLRPFRLPGGEAAVREPRRAALGLLYALRGEALWDAPPDALRCLFADREWALLRMALTRQVNAPLCSSIGRLFDAVAALLGLRSRATFDGQAAMELEAAAASAAPLPEVEPYPLPLRIDSDPYYLDPEPLVSALLAERPTAARLAMPAVAVAARRFHLALAESVAAVAERTGLARVLLTGGVFQNALLTEATIAAVQRRGATALWHQDVPPGDGGLAVGQVLAASAERASARRVSEVSACA